MWLLPSRERLPNLRRFFRACREMGTTTPGLVLVNRDELDRDKAMYEELDLPHGWKVIPVDAGCMFDALRSAWGQVSHLPWVGLLQDDLVPSTPGWDMILVRSVDGMNVVSANDNSGQNRMHGAIVWSGDLLRAMDWGCPYPQGFKHLYGDDVWEQLGRETGCWQVRPDVITKHVNQTYNAMTDATGASVRSHHDEDRNRFERWFNNERQACVQRIMEHFASKGRVSLKPDFSGVKLMIATPALTAEYHSTYMTSLFTTMQALGQFGVSVQWAEEKHNADVALARSKVFGAFWRSDCTHLLMVDADMGWEPSAVFRLFAAKKDLVAVAGPKKSYPLRFAANFADDQGRAINLTMDPSSGAAEVHEVGLAFALMTRACAAKMVNAYQDMAYGGIDGETEYALFIPMVMNRLYKAEDFAFCNRWRAIGGKVFICPDVKLKHTGMHTFEGSLSEVCHNPNAGLPALAQAAE